MLRKRGSLENISVEPRPLLPKPIASGFALYNSDATRFDMSYRPKGDRVSVEISAKKSIFSRDLAIFTKFNNEVAPIAPKASQFRGFGCCRTVSRDAAMPCPCKDFRRDATKLCPGKGFINRAIELSIEFHHQMARWFLAWKSSDR